MKAQSTGPILTAVFVDYDNIYLSLKRRNDEAAKRFAKDAGLWLKEIETGRLITGTNGAMLAYPRRIVMNRCYGNPVPRRNAHDNSTDMNSFPFMRHHFLRAGFEAIDCPPLTSQLKNSADIKMVLDIGDLLKHETYFDEFIILSGDADFTPVLHRLRAHARRAIVFANDHTAAPYTALSDGEIREANLVGLLLEGRVLGDTEPRPALDAAPPSSAQLEALRRDIVAEVVGSVRAAARPVPLEALADRAVRALGHERTVGSGWGGAGSFRDLLSKGLPEDVRLSDQAPYVAFDASRQMITGADPRPDLIDRRNEARDEPRYQQRLESSRAGPLTARDDRHVAHAAAHVPPASSAPQWALHGPPYQSASSAPLHDTAYLPQSALGGPSPREIDTPRTAASSRQPPHAGDSANALQESIARIHDACQAPPLSPPEYRVLFEVMAQEINTNNLAGTQTLANIAQRAREMGLEVRRDDVRFVLEVVSEADPWFEQGASANLFASRFRNFVVARCRSQGLSLSADEIDLIDAWFGGSSPAQPSPSSYPQPQMGDPGRGPSAGMSGGQPPYEARTDRWGSSDDGRARAPDGRPSAGFGPPQSDDEFPRIVRTRQRV